MVEKKFTMSELIENYGYPDVDYEKLVESNKRWCRLHGINFRDFRKSKKYTERAGYSTLGFAE